MGGPGSVVCSEGNERGEMVTGEDLWGQGRCPSVCLGDDNIYGLKAKITEEKEPSNSKERGIIDERIPKYGGGVEPRAHAGGQIKLP